MGGDHEVEVPLADRKEKSSKKSKHEKGEHKSKKRHREAADLADGTERKHKKSKSHAYPEDKSHAVSTVAAQPGVSAPVPSTTSENGGSSKKEKRSKKSGKGVHLNQDSQPLVNAGEEEGPQQVLQGNGDAPSNEKKKSKKDKKDKKDKRDKRDKKRHESQEDATHATQPVELSSNEEAPASKHKKKRRRHKKGAEESEATQPEPMDIDSAPPQPKSATSKTHGDQAGRTFPFFTQTVSQYLPLFPQGMVEPIEGYAEQHLAPLLDRYVPAFRGVLLAYRNPRIGEAPGKGSLTKKSEMEDTALLESIDEYAVGFGWLTVEADLFCPRRGSWMEGTLNLQSEGFIGVICFGKFNASIEASRLPSGWKWIDLLSNSSKEKGKRQNGKSTAAEAQLPTPEPQDENESGNENENENGEGEGGGGNAPEGKEGDATHQAHSTGYWVDETGSKVSGKLRFRIKNYEVGSIGESGYLSIEGTMLDEEAERAKVAEEMEADRKRKLKSGGLLRKPLKRLPEFSMTRFRGDDEKEDDILHSIGLKSKRTDSTNAAS